MSIFFGRLLGSARSGYGSTQAGDIDPQDACQERQSAQMGLPDALPQPVDGPGIEPVLDGPGGQPASDGWQVGGQQVIEGLRGGSLTCHDRTNSRTRQEKQSPSLDNDGQIADADNVENSPDCRAAFDGSAAAGARPTPEELAMETSNQTAPPAQLFAFHPYDGWTAYLDAAAHCWRYSPDNWDHAAEGHYSLDYPTRDAAARACECEAERALEQEYRDEMESAAADSADSRALDRIYGGGS